MALEKVVIQIKGDTKQLDPTITKLQKLGKIDKDNATSFKKNSKEFQTSTKKSGSLMEGLGKKALVLGTALIGAFAIKQVVGSAIKIIKDFEKEMSTLRSITGVTAKEMEFFSKAAFEIGRATKTAGTEVVKAFTIIGSAQPELLKNKEALASVTKQALILAKAAGIDTVQAAEALTGAMNTFGASASDAAKFTDIFATSQQKGSSFIIDTAEALRMVGASADSVGLSFETTTAAIQALAKGSIRGSMAGTALNAVLAQLSKQNDEKINPSVVGLSAALKELENRNLSFKEATKLVQIEGAKGLLTLIKQRDIFEELNGNLFEAGNAMEQMRINTDNLDGSLDELSNAFEELSIKAGENTGILQSMTDFATSLLQSFSGTGAEAFRLGKAFGLTGFQLGALREEMGTWADVVNFLQEDLDKLGLEVKEFGVITKTNVEGAISVSEALAKWRLAAKGLTEGTEDLGDETKAQIRNAFFLTKQISELRKELKSETVSLQRSAEIKRELIPLEKELGILTGKATKKTKDALTPLKLLQQLISKLKDELEGQALAGNISKDTLDAYTKAIKRAEKATQLLNDAIEDQGFEFKKLKPIVDDQLQIETVRDISLEEFFTKEAARDQEELDRKLKNFNFIADAAAESISIITGFRLAALEKELIEEQVASDKKLSILQDRFDSGLISEEEFNEGKKKLEKDFDKKQAELKTKQAKADKLGAIFNSIIQTAAGVVNALSQFPGPPGTIPFGITMGVLGAAQTALIAAEPIPVFHKGRKAELSDEEFPALIRKSEYVIPPEQSRKHREDLDAMLKNKFDHFVFHKYQMPIIKHFSKQVDQRPYDDFDLKRNQRKQINLLSENNQLLRTILPSMKRASIGWD